MARNSIELAALKIFSSEGISLQLNREVMINLLEKTLGYPRGFVDPFGDTVKMTAKQAFDFALVTGSSYLTSEDGEVLSNRMTIFYHRDYSFTPGLFGRNNETGEIVNGDSPINMKVLHPTMFESGKQVLFVDIKRTSNIESTVFHRLEADGRNPADYILTKVMPTGSGAEHFCEYVACMIFNRENYLTESQPPWSYYGNPDSVAYKLPELSDLWERGFISEGCLIQDLSTFSIFGKTAARKSASTGQGYEFIVGEAKTLATSCTKQLGRYFRTGLCTSAYEIIPHKRSPEENYGLISFNSDGTVNFHRSQINPDLNAQKRNRDKEWLLDYIKIYLIANLPIHEIKIFAQKNEASRRLTPQGLVQFIRRVSLSYILDKIDLYI
jgi:hypothetical protein